MNIRGSSTTKILFSLAVASLLVFSVIAVSAFGGSPGKVVIGVVPEQAQWVADGSTVYRVDLLMDNTGLGGTSTRGIQWFLENNPNLQLVGSQLPSQDDFFEGFTPMLTSIGYDSLSGRLVQSPGPANKNGIVASYWFTVNSNAQLGSTVFSFNEDPEYTGIMGGQPFEIQNQAFTIVAPPSPHNGGAACIPGTTGKLKTVCRISPISVVDAGL